MPLTRRAEQLARDGKSADAAAAFQAIAKSGPPGYALLARFRAAATIAASDSAAAVKDYDVLAADATIGPVLQDVARFRAALLRLDAADPKEMDERLAPLTRSAGTISQFGARIARPLRVESG